MKEKKVKKEIRFHEGFPFAYIVLPLRRRKQADKVSTETKHGWNPDSSAVKKKS
jgi:hypothetical protein